MKKIALIRPYYPEAIMQKSFPLGLGYLASVLKEHNYIVRIYDLNIIKISNFGIIQILRKLKFDFIGISALTCDFPGMIELSHLIKQDNVLKGTPIILGGVHVTFLPKFSLEKTKADFVVIGEGELTIIELLNTIMKKGDLHAVNGIAFFQGNEYIQTKPRELIKDIDSIPFPAWDLIHPERYISLPGVIYKKKPVLPIFTTRGCPYQCDFCASKNFWHQKIRFRSIQNIMSEIDLLKKKYGINEIQIWDDNFTSKRSFAIEFCREILKRRFNLYFNCPGGLRIDTMDSLLLKYMRSAGFYSFLFAIESGSQKTLNLIHKNLNLEVVPKIVKLSKKLGFYTHGSFILGHPKENINSMYKTLNFAKSLPLDTANFFILNPLPGSAIFNQWIKDKDIDKIEWDFDYFNNPQDLTPLNKLDPKLLPKFIIYFNIRFFLMRPWKVINRFKQYKFKQYIMIIDRFRFLIFHRYEKKKSTFKDFNDKKMKG